MRVIVKVIQLSLLILVLSSANAESVQEWCKNNQYLCDVAINTCEADDSLDCDAHMKKIKDGDVADLGKKVKPK